MMRLIEAEARETADRKAKEIIACSIQRYAGDYVGEHTVTAVTLPSEDMKGRIIGREGRNIRALEAATGVDLIIDDTPETVILSAYSPLRRQVAKMALERLIQDGRIHPARIEDVVHKCEQELEVQIREVANRPRSTRACTASIPNSSAFWASSATVPASRRTCSSIRWKFPPCAA